MDEIFVLTALCQGRKALPECLPNPLVPQGRSAKLSRAAGRSQKYCILSFCVI
ncbi:hypothetical protein [Nostoc sp. UHCC 0251]|uniref:hypothetical protein n=1 Tax=Nostoc sp. UHCC 0251 TaxID=3110240 RepID=UPI002B1F9CEA|nr:hypothetical protein [Nostoc sp. UHCC 0251]MEA5622714.1 hypothetical protein [Nostoc sp. UHCC 0251]